MLRLRLGAGRGLDLALECELMWGAGAAVGIGMGAGVGAGAAVGAGAGAGVGAGAETAETREIRLDTPKIRTLGQNGRLALKPTVFEETGGIKMVGFKTGKLDIRPRHPAIQFPFFFRGFSSKVPFYETLGPESTWDHTQFHRFLS